MKSAKPARSWQHLAEKTAQEQDPKRVVELANDLVS